MKKNGKKKLAAVLACLLAALFIVQVPVQAASSVSCSKLYDAVKGKCNKGAEKVNVHFCHIHTASRLKIFIMPRTAARYIVSA